MSLDDEYKALLAKEAKAKQAHAEAAGRVAQIDSDLKTNFDCDSIAEAKAMLAELEEQERELADSIAADLKSFSKEFDDLLCPPSPNTASS